MFLSLSLLAISNNTSCKRLELFLLYLICHQPFQIFKVLDLDISYLCAQDLTVNCGITLCALHLRRLSWQPWCKRINHSLASLVTLSLRILVFLRVLNILSLIIIVSLTFAEIRKVLFFFLSYLLNVLSLKALLLFRISLFL